MLGFMIVFAFNVYWLIKFGDQYKEVILFQGRREIAWILLLYNLTGLAFLIAFLVSILRP